MRMQFFHFHAISQSWNIRGTNMIADFIDFSVKTTKKKLYSHFHEILRENNFKGSSTTCMNQFHEFFRQSNFKKIVFSLLRNFTWNQLQMKAQCSQNFQNRKIRPKNLFLNLGFLIFGPSLLVHGPSDIDF